MNTAGPNSLNSVISKSKPFLVDLPFSHLICHHHLKLFTLASTVKIDVDFSTFIGITLPSDPI